jgi:hypothetical protein
MRLNFINLIKAAIKKVESGAHFLITSQFALLLWNDERVEYYKSAAKSCFFIEAFLWK